VSGGIADVEAFLARLVRLDSQALVRVHAANDRMVLWGRVPWDVLVSRTVLGLPHAHTAVTDADVVVRAADWLAVVSTATDMRSIARPGTAWRSPLPPDAREVLEEFPAKVVRGLGAAAADTLRTAETQGVGGRTVGARAVRDALLDHVAIVVSTGTRRVEIPQRLVQAVVRMGFAAADEPVRVLRAGPWVGLAAAYGTAWWRPAAGLTVTPTAGRVLGGRSA
jgi:hypothetical protein